MGCAPPLDFPCPASRALVPLSLLSGCLFHLFQGFFLEGDVCVMHLTMAPSLVDQDGRPFPCVTRGDGTNSCGHAADWQGALGVPENEASGLKKTGKL